MPEGYLLEPPPHDLGPEHVTMDPNASTRRASTALGLRLRTLRRTAITSSVAILTVGLGWTCVAAALDAAAVKNPSNNFSSCLLYTSDAADE